jgi:hypothetical protein
MLALPGSAYLYQGEELGLPEVFDLPDGVRQDPEFFRSGGVNRRGRVAFEAAQIAVDKDGEAFGAVAVKKIGREAAPPAGDVAGRASPKQCPVGD